MNKEELRTLKQEIKTEILEELQTSKKVFIELCRNDVVLPAYANQGDAGMDIRASVDVEITPGETKIVPTGLKMAIPDGYEIQVRPRSGLSLKTKLRVANTPGTIDSGYRDEIGLIMTNTSRCNSEKKLSIKDHGDGTYLIKKGDRLAQIVLCKYETINFEVVGPNMINSIGYNRGGGFGHSGVE